jgi:hypothetical protein
MRFVHILKNISSKEIFSIAEGFLKINKLQYAAFFAMIEGFQPL